MKQLLFLGAIETTGTEMTALTLGETMFKPRSTTTGLAVITDLAKAPYQIQTRKANGIESSFEFCNNDIVRVTKMAYSAGTAQVTTITPGAFPAVQKKGDEYILKIINTTPGTMNLPTKTFVAVHKGGTDLTATTLVTAFKALIGTDKDLQVVSSGTTTLVLTGSTPDNHFRVAVSGLFENAGVVYTTANVPSQGTPAKVKELEAECASYGKGVANKVSFPVVPASEVGTGNYDITVIELAHTSPDASGMKNQKVERKTIYLAETAGTSPVGALFAAL